MKTAMGIMLLLCSYAYAVEPVKSDQKAYYENLQQQVLEKAKAYHGFAQTQTQQVLNKAYKPEVTNSVLSSLGYNAPAKQSKNDEDRRANYQGMMLLVSLSMPLASLQALSLEAARFKIPLIIKGLYQDNYHKTVERVYNIIKPKGEEKGLGGFMIDPNWFDMYHIDQVPALVVTEQKQPCAATPTTKCEPAAYDIVLGNIPLRESLKIVAKHGEFAEKARLKLLEVQGQSR